MYLLKNLKISFKKSENILKSSLSKLKTKQRNWSCEKGDFPQPNSAWFPNRFVHPLKWDGVPSRKLQEIVIWAKDSLEKETRRMVLRTKTGYSMGVGQLKHQGCRLKLWVRQKKCVRQIPGVKIVISQAFFFIKMQYKWILIFNFLNFFLTFQSFLIKFSLFSLLRFLVFSVFLSPIFA